MSNRTTLMLFLVLSAPAAFAATAVPDASSFSLMGVTGLFLLGAIRRKLGK